MANSSITLTQLDFDSYKSSLKSYLNSQDRFKDYDFDGSNLSVLIDLLAYNTYQNAFYLNMVGNEMFLDSAKIRDSVVSHAKELNYLPRSYRSATAGIQLSITPADSNKNSIVVPKGTTFVSRVDDFTYTFSTNENIVISNKNNQGVFTSNNITIYEGNYLSDTYSVNYANPLVYKITNQRVDLSSVEVIVFEDNGSTTQEYTRATSLFGHNSTSKVFFLQAARDGTYEVVFGDGVVGRKPLNNSVVVIEYRISNGELPNGAFRFINSGRIDNEANVAVTTVSAAIDGAVAETMESIKFNAPRAFTTQERAVTSEDYENLLKANYPEINAVVAYGGEEADPPQFGRIFLSIDLNDTDGLPRIKQTEYSRFLKTRSSVAIEPVFISPEYTYVYVNSRVKYNINLTLLNPEDIRSIIIDSILNYSSANLNNFSKTLRYSSLVKAIDNSDTSIISNETDIELVKYLTPVLATTATSALGVTSGALSNIVDTSAGGVDVGNQFIKVDFKVPLTLSPSILGDTHEAADAHAVRSSPFTYGGISGCIVEDDGAGVLRIVQPTGAEHRKIVDIGTVNYNTGLIQLNNFNITNFEGSAFKIYASARTKDITSKENVILNIIENDMNISIEQIRE